MWVGKDGGGLHVPGSATGKERRDFRVPGAIVGTVSRPPAQS